MFKSKPEAYVYVLSVLTRMNSQQDCVSDAISKIRIEIENHQQDISVITSILNECQSSLKGTIEQIESLNTLTALITDDSIAKPSLKERFYNTLARRLESHMAIEFLGQPTAAMMTAVNEVSMRVLSCLQQLKSRPHLVDGFTALFKLDNLGFGYLPELNQLSDIEMILKNNSPNQLPAIIMIHFMVARSLIRDIDFEGISPQRKACGFLASYIDRQMYYNDHSDFFVKLQSKDIDEFSKKVFFDTDLFQERGRGITLNIESQRGLSMGLMRTLDDDEVSELPKSSYSWIPDARYQLPNYHSLFVRDCLLNDTIYIAGPSSMTSLLLTQMELLANMKNIESKQHYLLAIVAFLGAGGYHSLHEVIGPAKVGLNLVPGYNISVPQDALCQAPNYHEFFRLQASIDPEFNKQYLSAWTQFEKYFHDCYLPNATWLGELRDFRSDTCLIPRDINQETHARVSNDSGSLFFADSTKSARKMVKSLYAVQTKRSP